LAASNDLVGLLKIATAKLLHPQGIGLSNHVCEREDKKSTEPTEIA
jgi:hypothetical protein